MEKRSILVSCVELDLRFIFTKGSTLIDAVFKRFCGWAWGSGHCLHTVYMSRLLSRSCHIDGETVETVADFIFLAPKSLQMVTAAMKLKDAYSLEGKL